MAFVYALYFHVLMLCRPGISLSLNKIWIVGLWLFLVFEICLLIYMNITVFYLLLIYHREDIYYDAVVMVLLNWMFGDIYYSQACWLIERSEPPPDKEV